MRGGGISAPNGLERRGVGTLAVWTGGVAWMVVAGAIPSAWRTASTWLNEGWSDDVDPDPEGAVEISAAGSGGEGRVAVSGAGVVWSISETGMRGGGTGVGRVEEDVPSGAAGLTVRWMGTCL